MSDASKTQALSKPEVWFYHLRSQSLERALPLVLERVLANGWRAVVQTASPERVAALDAALWTYAEESFLPHGSVRDGGEARQPIWLTAENDNPNDCAVRVMIDGAEVEGILADPIAAPSERLIIFFDGEDLEALEAARRQYRYFRSQGAALSYWRQNAQGRWEKIS